MEIRRVRPEDWRQQREVRLRALGDAPYAFQTTYEEAVTRPDASWQERTTEGAHSETHALFVVDDGGRFRGLAGGLVEGTPPRIDLISVWVEPPLRGTGTNEQLVRSVAAWAAEQGHKEIYLWVTAGNEPAITLYQRLGFRFTGGVQPIQGRERETEREMAAPLAGLVG